MSGDSEGTAEFHLVPGLHLTAGRGGSLAAVVGDAAEVHGERNCERAQLHLSGETVSVFRKMENVFFFTSQWAHNLLKNLILVIRLFYTILSD